MSHNTQPSPGAISAAREIREYLGCGHHADIDPPVAAIIKRHTARPDVDELVKALEDIATMPNYDQDDAFRLRHKAEKVLTRHRAQNGGGL